MNELNLRKLAFEPEEAWVAELPKLTSVDRASMPLAAAALDKLIPPAPSVDGVTSEAPGLLAKIKDAAQKRNDKELEPLVHPDLFANKARVYDLFDITNYRNHALGRTSPAENRRVGVQFFQLTTSQVEKLHYLMFSTYKGNVVLRDVVTGPDVAALFLHDEEQLALSKLNLVFRALNDGDDSGLKNLCTPGLYAGLKELGGNTLLVGQYKDLSQIKTIASASLDQKSVRVVVRVSSASPKGKKLEYDVDFERVDKDLKVVRVRDLQGGVIAWDPDIDNYLNRRYDIPDGPKVTSVKESDAVYSLAKLRTFATRALENRDAAKLAEYAQEFLDRVPNGGQGEGVRAAAEFIQGKYDDAAKDAKLAIDRGGTAYFVVARHNAVMTPGAAQFSPVVLGVSKGKVEYFLPNGQGVASEQIPAASISQVQIETKATFGVTNGLKINTNAKPRPFLNFAFNNGGKKEYNFAAFGTACPTDAKSGRNDLGPYAGGSVCPAPQAAAHPQQTSKKGGFGIPGSLGGAIGGGLAGMKDYMNSGAVTTVPMQVPQAWQQELKVVMDAIVQAKS